MFGGNESFFADSDKALKFNKFLNSVLQHNSLSIKLINLDFSLSDVFFLLKSCDDSSAVGVN